MADDLTDVSGIGQKTAQKLRGQGITSKSDLMRAFKNRKKAARDLNKRAKKGIRRELTDRGERFEDPEYGVPVTPENQGAFEALDRDLGSDVVDNFGTISREKPRYQGSNLLDLAGEALKGKLGPQLGPDEYEDMAESEEDTRLTPHDGLAAAGERERAEKEAFEWGLDAAANLAPDLDRETVKKGNELAQQLGKQPRMMAKQEKTVMRDHGDEKREAQEKMSISAREYGRAKKQQKQRPPKARRVDDRRKAPVTDEITTWSSNMAHYDYPGLDTPGGKDDFVSEKSREAAKETERAVEEVDDDVARVGFGLGPSLSL